MYAVSSFFESGGQAEAGPASSQTTDSAGRLGSVTVDPPRHSSSQEGNEYYTGGAQSGLGVVAPPKPKDNDEYVKDLFKASFVIFISLRTGTRQTNSYLTK